MRTTLFALALLLSHAAAATTFVIGNEPFELEFDANPTNQLFSSRPSQLSVLSPPCKADSNDDRAYSRISSEWAFEPICLMELSREPLGTNEVWFLPVRTDQPNEGAN